MCAQKSNANSLHTDIAHAYWTEICDIEPLSPEEEKRLIQLIKTGDRVAYDSFIEHYLRLVVSRAKKYCHDFDSFMDLVQEGNLGLIHAFEKFDPDKGCRFSTYAQEWIDKYIQRESCRTGRPIRIPERAIGNINRLLVITAQFVQHNNREPNVQELADILDLTVEEVEKLQAMIQPVVSLDKVQSNQTSNAQPLIDKIPDRKSLNPEEMVVERDKKNILINFMRENLSELEFKVLMLRFGFATGDSQTFLSVSEQCGISKNGVKKAETRAIQKLQQALIQSGLTKIDFL